MTKFGAAAWTGSSAMLSEGVHSLADTGNEVLLLYGMRHAAKPRTTRIRSATGARSTSGASFTVHLAPDQIVGALRVQLVFDLRGAEIERAVAALVDEARRAHPELVRLFVTPLPAGVEE